MANVQFVNQAAGQITVALSAAATTLQFAYAPNSAAFPTVGAPTYFYLTITDQYSYSSGVVPPISREIVKVTTFAGGNMTVTRAQEGTTALAWNIGDRIEARMTNQGLIDLTTGASGAPSTAQYLTLALDAGLTAERVLTPGNLLAAVDTGANGTLTLEVASSGPHTILGNVDPVPNLPIAMTVAQVVAMLSAITGSAVVSVGYGTDAGKGAAGTAGRVWLSSDTRKLYYDTGAAWDLLFPAMTGDVTNTVGTVGTTIANAAVTNAKMANMGALTVKGNNTGAPAAPADLSQAQLTAIINSFTSVLSGAVPASGGGSSNFLRADGTWTVPGAGGGSSNAQVLINGGMLVAQRIGGTVGTVAMSTSAQYGLDKWTAWFSTGSAVSGTYSQVITASFGRTGYALNCSALGATGATVISMRQRIESKNAIRLKNASASFQCIVSQDSGSPQNCVVVIRKPTATDNYAGVTVISTSGSLSVASGTPTTIAFNSVAMGDCSTGIEIEVQVPLGAGPVNKTVQMTEAVLGEGSSATFPYFEWEDEYQRAKRYYQKTFPYAVVPAQNAGLAGSHTVMQAVSAASTQFWSIDYEMSMRVSGTPTFYNPSAANGQARNIGVATDCSATGLAAATLSERGPSNGQFNTAAGSNVGNLNFIHYTIDVDL